MSENRKDIARMVSMKNMLTLHICSRQSCSHNASVLDGRSKIGWVCSGGWGRGRFCPPYKGVY